MKKSLLFTSLNDHVPWGGSEVLWSKVAEQLSKEYYVAVLVKKWNDTPEPIKALESSGIRVYYKPIIKLKTLKNELFEKLKNKIGFKIKKQLNDLEVVNEINTFDLVVLSVGNHVDAKIVDYSNYLKLYNVPYIVLVQLATSLRSIKDNDIEKLKVAYNGALGVGCLSKENLNVLELQLGLKLNNIFKLNNPFNYYQEYLVPEINNTYQIACVAAYNMFHKGQDILLKVLSQDKWKQRNVHFNLYGRGVNEKHLQHLIKQFGLEDLVELKGFVSTKEVIWKVNHACILPSRMEGQSLAMLEAMSFGRMVISTKVGSAHELIDDGETGFLAESATVELLDKALERAWGKRDLWLEMGEKSRGALFKEISENPIKLLEKEIIQFLDKV